MSKTIRPAFASALAAVLTLSGCVPSDAAIESELSASRREAYLEWKAGRERGDSSEARADGPLSLDDAVKLALQYNKELKAVVLGREAARGNRVSAYQVITPSMAMGLTGTRYEDDAARGNLFSYGSSLSVTQPIFQGERIPASLMTARLNSVLADENIRTQVQRLISSVAQNYYDVLLAMRMVETYRESLISAEAQHRMVVEKKKQETATEYDVLSAQVDVANYRAKVQSAKNNIDTNRVTMLKNMGISQESDIAFSDRLEFLPMRPVLERAVELAMGLRPDIRTAQLDYRMSEQAVRIAKSAFWPTVAASFTQTWSGSRDNSIALGRDPWAASITGSLPLGISSVGDLMQAKTKAKQAQFGILDAQETAQMEIRLQMNNLANAEETVKYLVVNLDAAREALRLVEVGYQAGVKTEVDVTTARKALTDVMGQYYTALADHTKARLNLQLAMGLLGPSRVTDGTQLPPAVPIAKIDEFAAGDYVPPKAPVMPGPDTGGIGVPDWNAGIRQPPGNRPAGGNAGASAAKTAPGSAWAPVPVSTADQTPRAAGPVREPQPAAAAAAEPPRPAVAVQPQPVAASPRTSGALSLPVPVEAARPPSVATPAATVSTPPAPIPAQVENGTGRSLFKVKVREGA